MWDASSASRAVQLSFLQLRASIYQIVMRSDNKSRVWKIRAPSGATRDQTNYGCPKQERSSVGAWAIIGTKLRQTRGLPLSVGRQFYRASYATKAVEFVDN
jgi:hypothetical protein